MEEKENPHGPEKGRNQALLKQELLLALLNEYKAERYKLISQKLSRQVIPLRIPGVSKIFHLN